MATSATYYLDGPDIQSATAVFTDATLSTKAADGWYSIGGYVRQQISGVLAGTALCGSCNLNCGDTLVMDTDQGVYNVDIDLGATTGAVELTFDFNFVPDGVKVVYDGVTYNAVYSENFGYIDSPGTEPLYTGVSTFDCNLSAGPTFSALRNYQFNGSGFNYTGSTQSVTVNTSSVFLKVSSLGNCTMVIPKPNASPALAQLTIISPCEKADITVATACPVTLTSFDATDSAPSGVPTGICGLTNNTPFYNLPINGFPGVPDVGDIMFQDANGTTPAVTGYYARVGAPITEKVIEVGGNGLITAILSC